MPRPRKAPPSTRLAAALRERRGAASLDATATALGVSMASLARWERAEREPSILMLVPLARWLNVSVEEVIRMAGEPAPLARAK